jgi:nucleotide-binding universal stress UspA family protein
LLPNGGERAMSAVPKNVVVPLDGSEYSERAIGPANVLAKRLGGQLGVTHVARDPDRSGNDYLASVAGSHDLDWTDARVDEDVVNAIRDVAREHDAVVCMATHGHGRATAVIGSTAESVLAASDEPIVAIGRGVDTSTVRRIECLVVALDGSAASEDASAGAIRWAAHHGLHVALVTVVGEPLSAHKADELPRRAFGLAQPEEYIEAAVQRHRAEGAAITGDVVVDPISPASGMRQRLRDEPDAVLVIATSGRTGAQRIRHGSVAGSILDASPAPVILFGIPRAPVTT